MKTVETRSGCYNADECGKAAAHTCGSPDACTKAKSSGVVCTFGTLTRTTFHEPSDVAAEVAAAEDQHEKAHGGKPTATDKAAIRLAAAAGKNMLSVEAEQAAKDHGRAHGASNRTFHDANPKAFGHD